MNFINRKPRTLDRILAGLTMFLMVMSTAGFTPYAYAVEAVKDPDTECMDNGYDFGIAKWEWHEEAWGMEIDDGFPKAGYTTNVTGSPSVASWTADPAVAGIVAKAGQETKTFTGGTSGRIMNWGKDLSHVTFCGTTEEPETGTITVIKDVGDYDGTWSFDFTGLGDGGFRLDDENTQETFDELWPDEYKILEEATDSFSLEDVECVGAEWDRTEGTNGKLGVSVYLEAGDDVTCTFTNTYTTPNDVCPNLEGTQESVPDGMIVDDSGACVWPPADVCSNLEGVQTEVPTGYTQGDNNWCTPVTDDTCPNIDGVQETVPDGMIVNNDGDCEWPPVDLCSNLDGIQTEVPAGYTVGDGVCFPPVDVCPNLDGAQATLPDGMEYDENRNCVWPDEPEEVVNTCLIPSTDGHNAPFVIGTSPETPLATILANYGFGSINVNSDQKNYQTWTLSDPTADLVTFDVTVLGKIAGNKEAFIYYKAGDATTFVPVFQVDGHSNGAPEATEGSVFSVSIPAEFADTIGFAVDSEGWNDEVWHSEFDLNTSNKDNVAVYNPEANTYIVAFEDQLDDDNDYNDLVVKISKVTCMTGEEEDDEEEDGSNDQVRIFSGGGSLNTTGTRDTPNNRKRDEVTTDDDDGMPDGEVEGVQTTKVPTVAGANTGAGGTSPAPMNPASLTRILGPIALLRTTKLNGF